MNNAWKHTPGPWYVEERNPEEYDITTGEGGEDIVFTRSGANALLIASAPELLLALDELVAEWDLAHADEDQATGYTPDTGGIAYARTILNKATGREG